MNHEIEAFVDEYLGEMIEGNAAVFAGAGLSMPAGFVDWRNLIAPLMKELQLNVTLESDLVAAAQFHVNANGKNRHKLHQAVIEALSPDKPPTRNHQLLSRLPIKTWWTTNYDKLIENALREAGLIVDVKSATQQLATTRPGRDVTLFKMHGDVDRPDEAVATKDDYEKYEKERGAFTAALAGDLTSKTFLFLGFSFSDPNLDHVLTRVRLTFRENQRRHYAIFKNRTKQQGETDEVFDHHRVRQALVIEDLKRFNVRVLLVDDYAEITKILEELQRRHSRRTIFVSGSAADFSPWGEQAISSFCRALGRALVSKGSRVATGLGSGIGDGILSGALTELLETKRRVDDGLVLRPFPQAIEDAEKRKEVWEVYRREILSHCGIAIFLFGNKADGNNIVLAEGVIREFEIAVESGVVAIPIGATGAAAAELAGTLLKDPEGLGKSLEPDDIKALGKLAEAVDNLNELIEPLLDLVHKLQAGRK
ncbi:SIR2 family protein [Neorhizobium galegae]|uniref:NAD(+) hydrolase ThsA n=1 Tax=Neorhizobium galegae bv. officinalis TaxID=323656 RepID=A0A0T7H0R6_NEOGA|nr:SIR2 family protein [Neorhizobium galegae]CDZ53063.1 USG protein [Neorhizobium galegae bv. officinalis]